MPAVSVCIPSYNYAHYIGACIRSVVAQSFEDWELVIVDNCSSDNTQAVVRSFRDPRIRFYTNDSNIGLVPNWNRCLSLARGEYAAILPADDLYLPKMLERSVAMLDAHPKMGFTYASCHFIDEAGKIVSTSRQWESDRAMSGLVALRDNLVTGGFFAVPPSVLMRQECYRSVGGYDETYRLAIDWVLYMRAALSFDVGYIAEPLACFRYGHPTSESARKFLRRPRLVTEEELRLLGEIFGRLPSDPDWDKLRRQAFRGLLDRHVSRTHALLGAGDPEGFRAELSYAWSVAPDLPFIYRKMTALWLASLLSARLAIKLDTMETGFWEGLRGTQPFPSKEQKGSEME